MYTHTLVCEITQVKENLKAKIALYIEITTKMYKCSGNALKAYKRTEFN